VLASLLTAPCHCEYPPARAGKNSNDIVAAWILVETQYFASPAIQADLQGWICMQITHANHACKSRVQIGLANSEYPAGDAIMRLYNSPIRNHVVTIFSSPGWWVLAMT